MQLLSGSILTDNGIPHTLSNITLSGSNVIIFDLGDVDNLSVAWTGFTLRTQGVLLATGSTAGSTVNSVIRADYNTSNFKTNNTPYFDIVEPNISISKVYSPHSGDGWDSIDTTVTLTNSGTAPAYDIDLSDILPPKTSGGTGYASNTGITSLNPGQSITLNYPTILNNSVVYGEHLTGTASVSYTSYPGTPSTGEKNYSTSSSDTINVLGVSGLSKTLTSANTAKIWDTISYQIKFPVSEWVTNQIVVTDKTATGLIIVPSSISITPDAGVSYSGTVTPSFDINSASVSAGQSQTTSYTFPLVTNTNNNGAGTGASFITITYQAIVANTIDNHAGDTKAAGVTADYESGTSLLTASPANLTVQEPHITLGISKVYSYGKAPRFLFTITNTGTTTAYDIDLSTLMSSGLTYTGSLEITNSGGVINLSQSGDHFLIDSLPVNTGNPLTFSITGSINTSVPNNSPLALTGNLTYTSEAGVYSATIANAVNTERDGSLVDQNTYVANANTHLIALYPVLAETISVNKPVGIIGDVFGYTISLENTGSVDLTNIDVTLDIPEAFTGFILTSWPGWSTDQSTSTGWANNQGRVHISGINLPIGFTGAITYDVTAKLTVTWGTVVPSTALVSDTPEGATGGSPSVPVTINAPKYVVTTVETDDNGGSLYQNEIETHSITLTNNGTATGTLIDVSINYSSGFTYNSGSLVFMTGSKVDTESISIDSIARTIHFVLTSMGTGTGETLTFKSTATWPVGSKLVTNVSLTSHEWPSATGVSNELIIVSRPSGGGGGWGSPFDYCPNGDYSSSYYDGKCGTPPVTPKPTPTPTPTPTPKPTTSLPESPKLTPAPKPNVDSELVKEYQKLKDLKKQIQEMEQTPVDKLKWETDENFKLPSVLPKTGTPLLERTKILKSKIVETSLPNWVLKPDQPGARNLEYWLNKLPYNEDKSAPAYIVLPTVGVISPIVDIPKSDPNRKKLISGRELEGK